MSSASKGNTKDKLREIRKEKKQKLKEKRARLVVRNLPFETTEEHLRQHFEKFGEISDIHILKKEDGKALGCAFIQFKLVQKAAKAKHHTDCKQFMNREISVNFALAKDHYVKVKEEPNDDLKIKEEPPDDKEIAKVGTEENEEIKDEPVENLEEESEKSDESENEESASEESVEDTKEIEAKVEEEKKPRVISNDVNEGKTVFIKNVPFTATNEDLKKCMEQFGPVYYALICIDKITEHSKGTAFVKFRNVEDSQKALNAGTELKLQDNILDCHPALSRNEIQNVIQEKKHAKEQPKDSRNLYLVKEGVILAGTKAAEGVSATDMAKRLQIEQYKTQMLRNLNMFISRERLVMHNIPANWDDRKLRMLFERHSNKGAVIREARIMRDMRNVDAKGIGKSKEFGFIAFTRHEDALKALRELNNNPNVFTENRRPIITFAIENKTMVKAKQRRLENSRMKNPLCNPQSKNKENPVKGRKRMAENMDKPENSYSGLTGKPGIKRMKTKYNIKEQAQIHRENLKKEKLRNKTQKKTLKQKKQEFTKQPKQKKGKRREENDNFSKLVNEYKKKLLEGNSVKKTKWYE